MMKQAKANERNSNIAAILQLQNGFNRFLSIGEPVYLSKGDFFMPEFPFFRRLDPRPNCDTLMFDVDGTLGEVEKAALKRNWIAWNP